MNENLQTSILWLQNLFFSYYQSRERRYQAQIFRSAQNEQIFTELFFIICNPNYVAVHLGADLTAQNDQILSDWYCVKLIYPQLLE